MIYSALRKATKSSIRIDGFSCGFAFSRIITLLAIAISCVPLTSFSQEPGSPECALICEDQTFGEQAKMCECFVVAGKGKSKNKELERLGWPTPGRVIPPMIRAHEREIEEIEDYMSIDKLSITPFPDMRFFERKDGGDFIMVPVIEVQRRQMAADMTGAETGSDPEAGPKKKFSDEDPQMRARVAEDPTVAFAEMAKTLKTLSDEILGPGVFDRVAAGALEAAEGSSASYEEGKEGIEGADDIDGLFGDETLLFVQIYGLLDDTTIGLFRVDSLTFERIENKFEGISFRRKRKEKYYAEYFNNRFKDISIPGSAGFAHYQWQAHYHWLGLNTNKLFNDPDLLYEIELKYYTYFVKEDMRLCNIYILGDAVAVGSKGETSGKTYHELWACFEEDAKLRPARILTDETDYGATDAKTEAELVYKERISAEYRKVGPANLPHRFRESAGKLLDGVYIPDKVKTVERRRKYLINQGLPSTMEWTEILAESMADPFVTDDPP